VAVVDFDSIAGTGVIEQLCCGSSSLDDSVGAYMPFAVLATSTVFRSEPTAHEAQTFVETALSDQRTIMLIGRCTVVYDGRTASASGPGFGLLAMLVALLAAALFIIYRR